MMIQSCKDSSKNDLDNFNFHFFPLFHLMTIIFRF